MKWKRSKKAQQEAKMSKDEIASEKRQSVNPPSPSTKPTSSTIQDDTTSLPPSVENQNEIRRIQENETLYRPYVV